MDFQEWIESDPPNEEVFRICDFCEEDIYIGENALYIGIADEIIHRECYHSYDEQIKKLLGIKSIIATSDGV